MWAAIGALIGLGTSANKGAQAQYAEQRAEYEQSLQFSEAKDLSFYNAYAASSKNIALIAIVGFVFLIILIFLLLRKK